MPTAYAAACEAIETNDVAALHNEIQTNPESVLKHWKPLVDAAFFGRVECVDLLLAHGVDSNIRGGGRTAHTALTRICQPHKTIGRGEQHTRIVGRLLKAGADPLIAGGPDELIPLAWCYVANNADFITQLDGPTSTASKERGANAELLSHALAYRIEELAKHATSTLAKVRDRTGRNLLHYVGMSGLYQHDQSVRSLECARFLCSEVGIDPNVAQRIPDGDEEFLATPLWYTLSRQSNYALADYLLASGADPNPCVFTASFSGATEAVELLNRYSADWNTRFAGMTPLMDLVTYNRTKLLPWLLDHGADATLQDSRGRTVLHYAASRGIKANWIKLLVQYGCDPKTQDANGMTALDLAKAKQRSRTIEVLEQL